MVLSAVLRCYVVHLGEFGTVGGLIGMGYGDDGVLLIGDMCACVSVLMVGLMLCTFCVRAMFCAKSEKERNKNQRENNKTHIAKQK